MNEPLRLQPGASLLLSEVTTSARTRWWSEAGRQYAEQGRREGRWSAVASANVERCVRVWPARFEAAGLGRPLHARDVLAEMVLRWREAPMGPGHYSRAPMPLRATTAHQALWILRGFLREHGNPVAKVDGLWRMKRGDATRRRWFDGATVDRLWAAARTDGERIALALTAWAGLRRAEACSLRTGDVQLAVDASSLTVTRKGGRRQELPIARAVANALRPRVLGSPPTARVYPRSYSTFARDLREIGRRTGVGPVAAHDLRRTFGRMLYYEQRQDLNTIRVLYGHASIAMTEYYIGASQDALRSAVATLDRPRPAPLPPLEVP